jgi:hypothetical protein
MLLSAEVAAPLSKGNAWVALLGLGFDLPYILWGKRTLTKHYSLRVERARQSALSSRSAAQSPPSRPESAIVARA